MDSAPGRQKKAPPRPIRKFGIVDRGQISDATRAVTVIPEHLASFRVSWDPGRAPRGKSLQDLTRPSLETGPRAVPHEKAGTRNGEENEDP